jgi:hypothetical protein
VGSGPASEVPYVDHAGLIVLRASLADESLDCVLDTGCTVITWPNMLHLAGRRTGQAAVMCDARGAHRDAEVIVLPNVRIGPLRLSSVPTVSVRTSSHVAHRRFSAACLAAVGDSLPILGNAAFRDVVLTIDTRRRVVILQGPSAGRDRRMADRQAQGLRVSRTDDPRGGYLFVDGELGGHAARMVIDTGHGTGHISVSERFYQRYLGDYSTRGSIEYGVLGAQHVRVAPPLAWSLGPVHRSSPASIQTLVDGADAVVGLDCLAGYSLTIDYPAARLWLTRN